LRTLVRRLTVAATVIFGLALPYRLVRAAADPPHTISSSGRGAYEASLSSTADGFVAAWYDTRDARPAIYARWLDVEGRPQGSERRLMASPGSAYEPEIATLGNDVAVAWYERMPGARYRAMIGRWTRDGDLLWSKPLSTPTSHGRNPVVRTDGRTLFCAWLEYAQGAIPEVRAQWFDGAGTPLGEPMRIAQAGRTTWNLDATLDDRGWAWVTFDAKASTRTDELFLARVEQSSSEVVRLTSDDGKKSKYPDIALSGDRAALTWFDERDGNQEVYLVVGRIADLKAGVEPHVVRVTHTPGESIGAYVAWSQGRIGLAWCDNTEGQHEIYFATFDEQGRALEPPRRLTVNKTQSLIPAIHPARNGFALVWNEFEPGPGGGHDTRGRSEIAFTIAH
jgi:hypothetical protein